MIKKIIRLFVLTIILLVPVAVNASSSLELSCPKDILNKNEKLTCSLITNSSNNVGGVQFKVDTTDGLAIDKIVSSDNFSSSINENIFAGDTDVKGVPSGTEVASITFKGTGNNDNAIITIKDIVIVEVSSGNVTTNYDSNEITKEFKISSSSASSPFIPIGIAAGVVVLGAIIIVVAKKKK